MIQQLRRYLEKQFNLPFHFVTITETEERPCGVVRKSSIEHKQALNKPTGYRVEGIEVTVYADDYEALDDKCEEIVGQLNGEFTALVDGGDKVKVLVDDEDDEVYPPFDGSDDWIYGRVLDLRVHHKKGQSKCSAN